MAYVPVPNDLSRIKTKLAFNLTKRQLICFSIAGGIGIPFYLFTRSHIGNSTALFLMIGLMMPCFLFAIGFQGMLIMVCMAIYAVLVQSIATSGDMMAAIWECVGYTVLLVFVLFKTGSLSKSIFGAH